MGSRAASALHRLSAAVTTAAHSCNAGRWAAFYRECPGAPQLSCTLEYSARLPLANAVAAWTGSENASRLHGVGMAGRFEIYRPVCAQKLHKKAAIERAKGDNDPALRPTFPGCLAAGSMFQRYLQAYAVPACLLASPSAGAAMDWLADFDRKMEPPAAPVVHSAAAVPAFAARSVREAAGGSLFHGPGLAEAIFHAVLPVHRPCHRAVAGLPDGRHPAGAMVFQPYRPNRPFGAPLPHWISAGRNRCGAIYFQISEQF